MPTESEKILSGLLQGYPLPSMVKVRQRFPRPRISDVPAHLHRQLMQEPVRSLIQPGMRIAVTAGSRGIDNFALMLREICRVLRELGASPFLVPAMGSHGSATGEGQKKLLEGYGVTEAFCGAPIVSDMDTVPIGTTEDGDPVFLDKHAALADGIVVLGRIARHPDFSGPYESGIMKMMAVGLGKARGAELLHSKGLQHMARNVPLYGKAVLQHAPVLFAVAVIENAYHETCSISVLHPKDIKAREPLLLEEAKEHKGRILLPETDLLIVDRIGKDISGGGMDFHVVGAFASPYASGGLQARRRVVLDLTEESGGAMNGLGLADATTRRCFERCDLAKSYINSFTCTLPASTKVPAVLQNDREAIQACLKYNGGGNPQHPKVIRIRDTNHLEEIQVSEAHLPEILHHPDLELLSEPQEMHFLDNGYFP